MSVIQKMLSMLQRDDFKADVNFTSIGWLNAMTAMSTKQLYGSCPYCTKEFLPETTKQHKRLKRTTNTLISEYYSREM